MTWKAYAAVSGATVLAGWVVSAPPPSSMPAPRTMAPSRAAQAIASPLSDIEREAARLEARMRREKAYLQPRRDPFRFSDAAERVTAAADPVGEQAGTGSPGYAGAPVAVSAPEPAPLVSLAGIAEDQIDDLNGQHVERTAVLSAPDGVLLVREGDDVLGLYRVLTIESDAVELARTDGTTLRLSFRP